MKNRAREPLILLGLTALALVWSGVKPFDYPTWALEVFPVVFVVPLLWFTFKRFPLTPLSYRLIFIHALVLILGGHYTYANVPLGEWAREVFDLTRNPYDRLGHLAQGFIPAIVTREVLLRTSTLKPGKWLFFLVAATCLGFSAFYEFIEWWAALLLGQGADEFLGTQGDQWDTQWDMFLALTGAVSALTLLGGAHQKQLDTLQRELDGDGA